VPIENVGDLDRAATLVTVIHTVFENPELEDGKFSSHLGKWGLKKIPCCARRKTTWKQLEAVTT